MAFGQQSGPPATARQLEQLTELVLAAGHIDLRDARGPLGLTQRQAGGRFTRDEADELIARLEGEADGAGGGPEGTAAPVAAAARFDRRDAQRREVLARMPAEALAAELQRRGWVVLEPEDGQRPSSASTASAALRPGVPAMPPEGFVPAPDT